MFLAVRHVVLSAQLGFGDVAASIPHLSLTRMTQTFLLQDDLLAQSEQVCQILRVRQSLLVSVGQAGTLDVGVVQAKLVLSAVDEGADVFVLIKQLLPVFDDGRQLGFGGFKSLDIGRETFDASHHGIVHDGHEVELDCASGVLRDAFLQSWACDVEPVHAILDRSHVLRETVHAVQLPDPVADGHVGAEVEAFFVECLCFGGSGRLFFFMPGGWEEVFAGLGLAAGAARSIVGGRLLGGGGEVGVGVGGGGFLGGVELEFLVCLRVCLGLLKRAGFDVFLGDLGDFVITVITVLSLRGGG